MSQFDIEIETDDRNNCNVTCFNYYDPMTEEICFSFEGNTATVGQLRGALQERVNDQRVGIQYNNSVLSDDDELLNHISPQKKPRRIAKRGGARDRIGNRTTYAAPPATYFNAGGPSPAPGNFRVQRQRSPPPGSVPSDDDGRYTPPRRYSRPPSDDGRYTPPRRSPHHGGLYTPPVPVSEYSNDSATGFTRDYYDDVTDFVKALPSEPTDNDNPLHVGDVNDSDPPPSPDTIPENEAPNRCTRFLSKYWICLSMCGVCCIGILFTALGIYFIANDTKSTGECHSTTNSWKFSCDYSDGADWPLGWFAQPYLSGNWDEPGRLGNNIAPLPLAPNSKCSSSIEIGRYSPKVSSFECSEYCTHWCRVKEQQLLDASVGSLCCEAVVSQSDCTCSAHKYPSVVTEGNASTLAVLYKFVLHEYTTDVEYSNRRCVNNTVKGIPSEDQCYLEAFRMLVWALTPFPCHVEDYVPKNSVRDERCYYGQVVDDANPTVGLPLLIIGLTLSAIISFIVWVRDEMNK